jgi:tRNA(Arg) A34 adenosine deaminase TadA
MQETAPIHSDFHIQMMQLALIEAQKAYTLEEVPIGAVIVLRSTGQIIASCHNQTRLQNDPSAHAEILAIRQACHHFKAQRIPECDIYVTLEPCPMCSAAISYARLGHIYFGAKDVKSGGLVSGPALLTHPSLHHKPDMCCDILADESAALLKQFFQERR